MVELGRLDGGTMFNAYRCKRVRCDSVGLCMSFYHYVCYNSVGCWGSKGRSRMSIVKHIAKDLFHGSPHGEFPIPAVSKVASQIDCPWCRPKPLLALSSQWP